MTAHLKRKQGVRGSTFTLEPRKKVRLDLPEEEEVDQDNGMLLMAAESSFLLSDGEEEEEEEDGGVRLAPADDEDEDEEDDEIDLDQLLELDDEDWEEEEEEEEETPVPTRATRVVKNRLAELEKAVSELKEKVLQKSKDQSQDTMVVDEAAK
jgi:hypothetical protein